MSRFVQRLVVGGLIGAVLSAAPVHAGHGDGWYIGLEGGVEAGGSTNTDVGTAFIATVGSHVGAFRVEGELGVRSQSQHFTLGDADLDQTSFMINGVYDVALGGSASLSLGAGLGYDDVETNSSFFNGSGTEFAGQAIAGLNLALTERIDLVANFRYMAPFASGGNVADVDNTTVTAGLRFAF